MVRVCPHSDSQCPDGMGCGYSCATSEYDGTKRPTQPMTPREKVEREVLDAVFSGFEHGQCEKEWEAPYGQEIASKATDAIITALASGSGDHAELARLAERCTTGDPWYKEGDLRGRQTFEQFLPQDRAFIAAANPATVLALIAENAALRGEHQADMVEVARAAQSLQSQRLALTEAERKLAEADTLLAELSNAPQPNNAGGRFSRALASINAYMARKNARTFLSSMEAERG